MVCGNWQRCPRRKLEAGLSVHGGRLILLHLDGARSSKKNKKKKNKDTLCDPAWPSPALRSGVYLRG